MLGMLTTHTYVNNALSSRIQYKRLDISTRQNITRQRNLGIAPHNWKFITKFRSQINNCQSIQLQSIQLQSDQQLSVNSTTYSVEILGNTSDSWRIDSSDKTIKAIYNKFFIKIACTS